MIEDEVEPYANQVWGYLQLGMEDEARMCLRGILSVLGGDLVRAAGGSWTACL